MKRAKGCNSNVTYSPMALQQWGGPSADGKRPVTSVEVRTKATRLLSMIEVLKQSFRD